MTTSSAALGQLFGLHLDTSTWVAITAASIALVGLGVNVWNVSRTLKRNETNLKLTLDHATEQRARQTYDDARDRALAALARASIAFDDLNRYVNSSIRHDGTLTSARNILADLSGAFYAFAAYTDGDDIMLGQFAVASDAFQEAIDLAEEAVKGPFEDRHDSEQALREAHDRFRRGKAALTRIKFPS